MDMPGGVRVQPGEISGSCSEAVTADLGPQVPLRPEAGLAGKDDNVAWEHNTGALAAWLKRHDGQASQQASDAVERALANWINCQTPPRGLRDLPGTFPGRPREPHIIDVL